MARRHKGPMNATGVVWFPKVLSALADPDEGAASVGGGERVNRCTG